MRIGFLITYFYPYVGGAENNCYYLARELAKKHEVHVFCSGTENKDEKIDGINIHRIKEIFRLKYYFAFYPSLSKKLKEFDLDILHVHGLGFIQHDIAVKKIKKYNNKIKIVCTPHGPFMALNKYSFIGTAFKKFYTYFIKKGLKAYDLVFQVNPYQKEWMIKDYGINKNKIKLLSNGINEESIINRKYPKINKKVNIVYVGRVQRYKGLDQVINALGKMKEKEFIFNIVGKNSGDRARLEKISKELGLDNKIVFLGEVSDKKKEEILEKSDIFVFPSEWEAFGIAMLEGMAKGNAVISSKTEGGSYLISKENGFLFDYGDIDKLTINLKKLIENKRLREDMGKANIQLAKNFLWEDIAVNLEKEYKKLLN